MITLRYGAYSCLLAPAFLTFLPSFPAILPFDAMLFWLSIPIAKVTGENYTIYVPGKRKFLKTLYTDDNIFHPVWYQACRHFKQYCYIYFDKTSDSIYNNNFNNMESLPENIEEYKKFKVVDLKQFLSNVGLPTNGKVSIASKFWNAVR